MEDWWGRWELGVVGGGLVDCTVKLSAWLYGVLLKYVPCSCYLIAKLLGSPVIIHIA